MCPDTPEPALSVCAGQPAGGDRRPLPWHREAVLPGRMAAANGSKRRAAFSAVLLFSLCVTEANAGTPTISFNDIAIDAGGPGDGINQLSLIQDSSNPNNQIAGTTNAGSTTPMAIQGPWKAVSVTQSGSSAGGSNVLAGSLAADAGSSNATLNASYSTTGSGDNVHALNVGSRTNGAPVDPSISVSVANTGASPNDITDILDSGSSGSAGTMTYTLGVNGTGNTITNNIQSSQSLGLTLNVAGSQNAVTNMASGGSSTTINQTLGSSNNSVNTQLSGSGSQSATLSVTGNSAVNYALNSSGSNQSSNVTLTDVIGNTGNASAPADVVVYQTNGASGGSVSLSYNGNGYTAGNLSTSGLTLPSNYSATTGSTGPAIYIYQYGTSGTVTSTFANTSSPGATASGPAITVTGVAASNGYTVKVLAP